MTLAFAIPAPSIRCRFCTRHFLGGEPMRLAQPNGRFPVMVACRPCSVFLPSGREILDAVYRHPAPRKRLPALLAPLPPPRLPGERQNKSMRKKPETRLDLIVRPQWSPGSPCQDPEAHLCLACFCNIVLTVQETLRLQRLWALMLCQECADWCAGKACLPPGDTPRLEAFFRQKIGEPRAIEQWTKLAIADKPLPPEIANLPPLDFDEILRQSSENYEKGLYTEPDDELLPDEETQAMKFDMGSVRRRTP